MPKTSIRLAEPRENVLRLLWAAGGEVTDKSGRVTMRMSEPLGYTTPQGLSALLRVIERGGMIERDMNGKRTFRITLTEVGRREAMKLPPWIPLEPTTIAARRFTAKPYEPATRPEPLKLAPAPDGPALSVPEPEPEPEPDTDAVEVTSSMDPAPVGSGADVTAVAEALLNLVLDRITAEPKGTAGAGTAAGDPEAARLRKDLHAVERRLADTLEQNQRHRNRERLLADEVEALKVETRGLRMKLAATEQNLAKQLELAAHAVTVGERGFRTLDRLIRETPRTPPAKTG